MRGHYNGMYAEGGDISPVGRVTPYGQWWYPGEVTTIPGNDITMRGVNYPVLGVSNKGDRKLMMPGRDYKFRGDYVTEYPMFGNGGHLFQKGGHTDIINRYIRSGKSFDDILKENAEMAKHLALRPALRDAVRRKYNEMLAGKQGMAAVKKVAPLDFSTLLLDRSNVPGMKPENSQTNTYKKIEPVYVEDLPIKTRKETQNHYDPTGGLDFFNRRMSYHYGNMARGEENEYWKAYMGLPNAVPKMDEDAKTEWDDEIEDGLLHKSDFYGITPRIKYNIETLADTMGWRKINENAMLYYDNMKLKENPFDFEHPFIEYGDSKRDEFADENKLKEHYKRAKEIMENPNKWIQVDSDELRPIKYKYDEKTKESNPLGMFAKFGIKWVPQDTALYIHDTYDFPDKVHKYTSIPRRKHAMKIRAKIPFDPNKGSYLLQTDDMLNLINYDDDIEVMKK